MSPVQIQVPLPDKGAAQKSAPFIRPVGQVVKTPPFHGGNMGPNPVRVTIKDCTFVYHDESAVFSHFRAKQAQKEKSQAKQGFGVTRPAASEPFFYFRQRKKPENAGVLFVSFSSAKTYPL